MLGSPQRKLVKGNEALTSAVARSFKGGLNTFDPALTMPSTYLTELRNMYPTPSGDLRVRFGTTVFGVLAGPTLTIVAMEYYIDRVVLVVSDGSIQLMDSDGVITSIGTPWTSPVYFASFTQFGGNMVICNGVDKPLLLEPDHTVSLLVDLGTISNVNTPRAKYCTTHNNYVVMAGVALLPTKLYISSKGTSGTYAGDPAPNDGIVFDTSAYVSRGSPDITGVGSFRDRLIVTFDECILAIKLGDYDGTDHVPTVEDVIDNHGAVSHRTIVALGDDMLFLDKVGIASVQRALISNTLSPTRESTLVSRDLQRALSAFSVAQLNNGVWAINDRIAQQVLFFMPKEYDDDATLYTPTTLNPLDKDVAVTLTNGNLTCTMSAAGKVRTVLGQSTGKWYFQFVTGNFSLAATNVNLGIAESTATTADLAGRLNCAVINSNFGNVYVENVVKGGSGTFGANALIEIAVDLDAKKIWVRPSITSGATLGIWNSSGVANPATGVGGYDTSAISGTMMPCAYFTGGANHTATYNFGPTYAGISGPPTGFSSWGTSTDVPSAPTTGADNDVYVLCMDKSQKFRAMTYFDQMPYRCGCRTSDGRIFVSNGADVFYYRNQFEPQYLDFATEGFQLWSDGTPWTDLSGWYELGTQGTLFGTKIPFAAATPWSDMKQPDKIKDGRYLHCVMEGDGEVTIKQYNDRFRDPQLSLDFNMTTYPETPDNIERPLNNDQLYAWNSRFTRAKLRISGTTDKALSLLSLGLLYLSGGYRR